MKRIMSVALLSLFLSAGFASTVTLGTDISTEVSGKDKDKKKKKKKCCKKGDEKKCCKKDAEKSCDKDKKETEESAE